MSGRRAIDLLVGARCLGCARVGTSWCARCDAAARRQDPVVGAAFRDVGPVRRLVRAGKFGRASVAAAIMASLARERLATDPERFGPAPLAVDAVAWVPADRARARLRGGHLPARYARQLARRLRLPRLDLLARAAGSPPQLGLDRAGRLDNARRTFHLHPHTADVSHAAAGARRVLLVDDVTTTGATLEVCSNLLETAGFQVISHAFCHAPLQRHESGDSAYIFSGSCRY